MNLANILLQAQAITHDTIAAKKIQAATDSVKAGVDSLANKIINPDSLATLTPTKVVDEIKSFDWSGVITGLSTQFISFALRLLAAIAIFYIGRFIINKIHAIVRAIFISKGIDRSLGTFLLSFIKITLLFLLVITVIGVLGIETSSFIAIFASAGVAIGMALSGTLQNFAGGVLILLIKPYKVGDYIEFGTFKGFVKEIQIFHTIITTYNNERIIIPNGGLSTGSINNYSAEPYRRLEWRVSLAYGDDVAKARQVILDIIDNDERIVKTDIESHEQENEPDTTQETTTPEQEPRRSWIYRIFHRTKNKVDDWKTATESIHPHLPKISYAPNVNLESLDDSAIVLIVRAWAKGEDYWGVLYSVNEQIYTQLPQHGLHFPFPQLDVHLSNN